MQWYKSKKATLLITFFLLLMNVNQAALASTAVTRTEKKQIQTFLNKSNANVMVLVNGPHSKQPVRIQHSTVAKDSPQYITENKLFPIGSTQKMLTGMLVLRAIKAHKLSFNTKLSKYYPQVPNSKQITVRELLTHTSGLADKSRFSDQPLSDQQAQLNYSISHLSSSGGHGWIYASVNYALLAGILSKVYHESYAELVKNYYLAPNDLHQAKFYYQVQSPQDVLGTGMLAGNQQSHWHHIKRQLSTYLGAGDMLISPANYWVIVTQAFNTHRPLFEEIMHAKVAPDSHYFAGGYVRDGILHSNGTVEGYTCNVFTNGKQTMMLFSNSMSSKDTDALSGQVAKVYFK